MEDKRGRGRPRATWTDNIKDWWKIKEAGEDLEPHRQTTPRTGGRYKRQGKTKSPMERQHQGLVEDKRGRGRPRATWRDNIKDGLKIKEAGEDLEPHGQTTSRTGGR